MKKMTIAYWIVNGLFGAMMMMSAIPDVLSVPMAVDGFARLGLPRTLLPFVGVAKLLGVLAILIPGRPLLKEWAYAGLTFDLLGATYLIIASGQPSGQWIFMALPLLLDYTAYRLYHKRRSLRANTNALAMLVPGGWSPASVANNPQTA